MADDEHDQLMLAEPRECSRWAMACVLGCTGVLIFRISCFLIPKSHGEDDGTTAFLAKAVFGLGFMSLLLALFFVALFGIVLIELCSDKLNSEGQKLVDELLSL
jgi:hypothetical protein